MKDFVGNITNVSSHAIDRAVQRFKVERKLADAWIRSTLKKAKFVSNIISDEGDPGRLFVHNRIAIVMDIEVNRVITIMEPNIHPSIYEKVALITTRELKRKEAEERRIVRRNEIMKAELNVELSELKLRLLRARASSTINVLKARIDAINERMSELDSETYKIKREKSIVAKAVSAYL